MDGVYEGASKNKYQWDPCDLSFNEDIANSTSMSGITSSYWWGYGGPLLIVVNYLEGCTRFTIPSWFLNASLLISSYFLILGILCCWTTSGTLQEIVLWLRIEQCRVQKSPESQQLLVVVPGVVLKLLLDSFSPVVVLLILLISPQPPSFLM